MVKVLKLEKQYPKFVMYCRIRNSDKDNLKEDKIKLKETINQLNRPRQFIGNLSKLEKYQYEKI